MLVGEVGAFGVWVKKSAVAADRLWSRPLSQVTEMEIQLFYARNGLNGLRDEAIDAIERLQAAVITMSFHGTAHGAPLFEAAAIIQHETPEPRYLVDEFLDGLAKLSAPRRMAVLFDLELVRPIENSHTLTWDQVLANRGQLTRLARETLAVAMNKRLLKLPYVFWEWTTPNLAGPLMGYREEVEKAFGMSSAMLQGRYTGMIMVDRRADSRSLLQLLADIGVDGTEPLPGA